ncbi:MAG: protein BatD [Sphingobacteriales bacterium]|nr:MAG: protein BatD [Sphingobacteriales bacterium]
MTARFFTFALAEELFMNPFVLRIYLLLFVSLLANLAGAQVKYKASMVPSQINKDEYATLRLEIENASNVQQVKPPSLKDFNVVSGPNQETGMSSINGVSKTYMAISYVVQPRRAGKFTIGESAIVVGGKEYKSGPIHFVVKNESGRTPSGQAATPFSNPFIDPAPPKVSEAYSDYILKKGESVPEKVNKNMQLRLQTNKTTCYVGEPVIATYKLYTRLKSESKMTKAPSFNGFSVIDLLRPDETEQNVERLNGREYNVYTVRKSQLYPLQDGDIELEAATLDNRIQFIKEGTQNSGIDDFFGGMTVSPDAVVTQSVSLNSKPLTIHVKPLPEGKPASFNGAVGDFRITSSLEKNNFGANEAGKLIVTISGSGNLQLITSPDISWPAGMEAFDAKVQDEYDQSTVPVSGRKTFVIPFTVNTAGEHTIPLIRFSYFDPAKATYQTDSSKPIAFTVVKGSTGPSYDIDTLSQKKPVSVAQQIFSNREWIVGAVALLIMGGLFLWNKNDRKAKIKKRIAEEKFKIEQEKFEKVQLATIAEKPQNPLHKTEECLNSTDCTDFYKLLNVEFKQWLSHKFSLEIQDVNSKKIAAAFDKSAIDNSTTLQVQQLMQEIEWQLYTPFDRTDTMHDLYSRAQSAIQTINSHQLTATL